MSVTLAAGCLLVARPELTEPSFMRSVIYVLEHHAGGSMGVIINRPLAMDLGGIWDSCPSKLCGLQACSSGGPVELHKGLLLHSQPGIAEAFKVGPGLYIGGDQNALQQWFGALTLPNDGSLPLRLFLGHAGWGAGQLPQEVGAGSWLVCPGHPRLALDNDPDTDFWETRIRVGPSLPQPSVN